MSASSSGGGGMVPRVYTGTQLTDWIVPIITYALSTALVDASEQYTDQTFLLLVLAVELFALLWAAKCGGEWLARLGDGVVDSYERVLLAPLEFVRWLLFFMLAPLGLAVIKGELATQPLPALAEAVALASVVVCFLLVVLPAMFSNVANVASVTFLGGGAA